MSKLRIAGYLRISVDTEIDKDSTSIENQRSIIKEFVEERFHDCELDFYTDRDRSGYTFEQREGYQKMRPNLLNGYYSILVVKDFSRFSRRNSKGLAELEDLAEAGVRIISIGDAIDYPTGDEWNNIQMRFLFNEMPVTDASKKVRKVIDSRQKKGEWVCAVPYGYYITNTKTMDYTVDESVVPVIQEIFDLYLKGWGYKKISHYLTERKIPTPREVEKQRRDEERALRGEGPTKIKASSGWAVPTIKEILVNDFYIGTLRQKKFTRARINGKDKRVAEAEQKVFENHHEAIIDVRTFAKVQEQLKMRTTSHYRGQKKYDTDYSGFLFCGDCGSPMFSRSDPRLTPQYICGAYHKHGTNPEIGGCTSHTTKVSLLDTMIKKYIERVMMNSQAMIAELEKGIKSEPQETKKDTSSLEALELELAKARDELKNNTKFRNRDITRAEARYKSDVLEKEIDRIYANYEAIEDELRSKIDGLESQVQFLAEQRNTRIQINRIAKTALDIFRDILAKDKLDKGDLALIVDRITIFDDNIEIKLKADVAMLLESGTVSKELLEQSSYVGTAVNFNWDTKSNSNAQVVQKAVHQKDKAFSVNVVWEGDPLEIYTEKDGGVIFRKYSPMGDLQEFAAQMCDSIFGSFGHIAAVTDRDGVIAVSGASKRELLEKPNTAELLHLMEERKNYRYSAGSAAIKITDSADRYAIGVAVPILCQGDLMGSVVLLMDGDCAPMTENDLKLAQATASFLGRQMES